jgi:hypothetical protein
MHAVFPMDKMVGPMFEDGLKALKGLTEKAAVSA